MGLARLDGVRVAWIVAGVGLLLIVGGYLVAGRLFGREPGPAWICDDTRYTQLVPLGRAVVGPPVSPPPGCRT
jgi:hypothetical protein